MPPQGRRVLVLSNFFAQGHGGTPESVLLLAREIAHLAIAVDVFCDRGLLKDAQNRDALPTADDTASFSAATPSPRAYDAVFVAGSWNRRAPLLVLRAVLAGVPVSYAAKGCLCRIEFERLRDMRRVPYLLLIEWWLLALSRRIIFSSDTERWATVLPAWLWRRKAVRLEEPFQGGEPGPAAAPSPVPILGFLAEISSRKGLFELIDGLGHYLAQRPDMGIRLRIAGQARRGSEAYFRVCRRLAEQNGSAAHIEWCEPVRGEARADFYRSLDLFLCPSRFESFGLTPLEALWQGTPVCLGPQLGVLEYMQPDAPLLRLHALGKEEIADAIATCVDAIEDWRGLGHAWKGRHALTRSNTEIAADFARILLDAGAA